MKSLLHLRTSGSLAGPERCLLELCGPLEAEGFRVDLGLIHRSGPVGHPLAGEAAQRGLRLESLPDRGRWSLETTRAALGLAERVSAALVHGHDPKANRCALELARRRRVPSVATVHLHTRETLVLRLHRWFDLFQLRRFDAVLAVSGAVARELRRFVAPSRLHVVPNGLDVDLIERRAAGERAAARAELNARGAGPWIVGAGRLVGQKGFDLLLAALATGREPLSRARLALLGDGPELAALRRRSAAAGLAGRVWLAGERRDVGGFLAAADLVALPSRREGLPYVALEALALGRPVVASRAGGLAELIDDGESGWLVPIDDAPALARALAEALEAPAAAAARGERGREHVRSEHTAAGMARRVAEIYRAVLAGSARA